MPLGNKGRHRTGRVGWLRAAVLGASDGILSTTSLVLGVAAAHSTHSNVLVAGVAGLVAGAMSQALRRRKLNARRRAAEDLIGLIRAYLK
jgi:vacuolar iron transporter family protein